MADPVEVVVEDPEPAADPSQAEGVKVDLKPGAATPAAPKPATPPADEAGERRMKALENQLAAQRRVTETLQRQLAQRPAQAPAMPTGAAALPAGTAQETVDKYDQLVTDGRWQEAVRLLSREEARTEYQTQQALTEYHRVQAARVETWQGVMQRVRSRYPQLDETNGDPASQEWALYNEAVAQLNQQDANFAGDIYAAELAMRRMEDLARERGLVLKPMSTPAAQPRTPGRGVQTSMPASRRAGGAATYTLTKDQKDWCDLHLGHLPEAERYKGYAGIAQAIEQGGTVHG